MGIRYVEMKMLIFCKQEKTLDRLIVFIEIAAYGGLTSLLSAKSWDWWCCKSQISQDLAENFFCYISRQINSELPTQARISEF